MKCKGSRKLMEWLDMRSGCLYMEKQRGFRIVDCVKRNKPIKEMVPKDGQIVEVSLTVYRIGKNGVRPLTFT